MTLTFRATLPGGAPVHIGALMLPTGAKLSARDGNPAQAVFRWLPTQAGTFVATFTAQDVRTRVGTTHTVRIVVQSRAIAVSNSSGTSRWAFVLRPTTARKAPSSHGASIGPLGTRTPEGTQNLVLVLQQLATPTGTWYKVRLPILPNNSTGWVAANTLSGLHDVQTQLVVDRNRLVATLYRKGHVVLSTPVGVGQARYPTPAGEFYVRDLVVGYTDPFYGPLAFGTSGRSQVLTEWPNGGFIGIHGTNSPGILPGRVSLGCFRMRNASILQLRKLMPIGTPITVR
jgi:hypothetical protein